jgi:hypothetical protein
MAKVVKSNIVNKEILELSIEHDEIYDGKIPLLYNHFKEGESQLLFIGLNPSFSDNIFSSFKSTNKDFESPWSNKNEYDIFFNSRKIESEDILKIIEIHENSIEHYPYFNKFKEIEKETKKKFTHIDLFHCRRTSQKKFIDDLLKYEKRNDYIKKSIKILEVLIKQISPKIIIIENTATRDFLIKYASFPDINSLDKESGTPKKDGIPIFYTSMLTGQRALDLGSYHRLIWHIKHCLTLLDIK